jgi:hypothetical protein
MITADIAQAYQTAATIQSKIASYFTNSSSMNAPSLTMASGTSLQAQLQNKAQVNPSGVGVIFTGLPDILDFAGVLGQNKLLGIPSDILGRAAGFFTSLMGSTNDPQALLKNVRQAIDGISQSVPFNGLAVLPQFLKGQLSIAISIISVFGRLSSPTIPQKVEDAYVLYLFDEKGFETIDGDSIAPPTNLSDFTVGPLSSDFKTLKDAFSEKSAVRYVRDLVRIPVEAACDEAYNLPTLLDGVVISNFPAVADQDAGRTKIIRWMKGFSSMAESGVTGAVEEACSGIGSFQTNQLIAAAAGTFAGTWARKVTQNLFLNEI